MGVLKKYLIAVLLVVVSVWAYFQWMHDPCGNHNRTNGDHYSLLIANEGSHFKDSVVRILQQHYRHEPVKIKTVSLRSLAEVDAREQHAIVILHSWYTWEPPPEVEKFIKKQRSCLDHIVVLTTSIHGGLKMDEVDAITGPSKIAEAEAYASKIIERLTPLLTD